MWKERTMACTRLVRGGEGACRGRDLARNEEFSKIVVIKKCFTVLKNKTQLSVGEGLSGENFEINHANQQFNTCLLTCKQTRKIYEHSHRCANTLHPAKNKSLQTEEYYQQTTTIYSNVNIFNLFDRHCNTYDNYHPEFQQQKK